MKHPDPAWVAELERRAPTADPEDAERRRRFANELFVELSRRKHPVGSALYFVLDHSGGIRVVRETNPVVKGSR